MEFGQCFFHFTPREDYLSYFRLSAGWLPAVLQYAIIPYCARLPLGAASLVLGNAASNVFPFRMLPGLSYLL
jgi:hypothetical protein